MSTQDDSIRLMLAYLCIAKEAEASLERKVEILDRFSMPDADIATVCAATVQSIRNARSNLKGRRRGKKG